MRFKRQSRANAPSRRQSSAPQRPTNEELASKYAFRRNRTLTGSSSVHIASTNELNAELQSPRAQVHHLTSLRRRLLTYFAAVGLACFGLYILVSQLVATTVVSIDSMPTQQNADTAAYTAAFDSYYAARPVERFRFLLNESALLSHVRSDRPEVRSLMIEPGSKPGEASVSVMTRVPIARWSINGSDQFVDEDGVVFNRNFHEAPLLQIVDDSGLAASSDRLVASDRFLGFIGLVVAKASRAGLAIERVTIPPFTTKQVALTVKGSKTVYRLSVDRSAGEQVEDMSRIRTYLASNSIMPEYVDVRIAGKAFYK